jgi:putative transcriptional regulator
VHTVVETPVFIQSSKRAGVTAGEIAEIIALLASTPNASRKKYVENDSQKPCRHLQEQEPMSKAGKRLIESAQQALDFAEGTTDASVYRVHIPSEIDVKQIRENQHMSQSEFAKYFGFSVRTLQQWEQGRSAPQGVARNFLILLQRAPEIVRELLIAHPKPPPDHTTS